MTAINEYTTVYQFFVMMLGLSVGCFLYSLGGRSNKWIRRFLGSFVLALTFNGICAWRGLWNPLFLLIYSLMIGAFVLPYGADTLLPKILKRSAVVGVIMLGGLLFCLVHPGRSYYVLIPNLWFGVLSVYLGVKNDLYAPSEEGFVCLLLSAGLMMYPFVQN